jgi:hypothetical protein
VNRETLRQRAREGAAALCAECELPYFRAVIATLVRAKLFITTRKLGDVQAQTTIQDLLRAGEIEPRVIEVLPALILKHPDLVDMRGEIPDDLKAILNGARPERFRGLRYDQWLP